MTTERLHRCQNLRRGRCKLAFSKMWNSNPEDRDSEKQGKRKTVKESGDVDFEKNQVKVEKKAMKKISFE